MTRASKELRDLAQRLLEEHISTAEFCLVYEDDDAQDLSDEELRKVHDLILHATGTLRED